MAFLDNSGDIILDAVLTDTGRYRLAQGDGSFKITKFALADDEINYELYRNSNHEDGAHTSGSAYYDLEILQTPSLEAFTNNASSCKHRLMSLAKTNIQYLPVIKINDLVAGHQKESNTQSFLVYVDQDSTDQMPDATAGGNAGHINGYAPPSTSTTIRLDQGLDSDEGLNYAQSVPSDLLETQYIIQIDNRFGSVVSPSGTTVASLSFVDDDQVASYYLSLNNDGQFVSSLPKGTGTDGQASVNVIAGARGTTLNFSIQASIDLMTSTHFFTTLGGSKDAGGSNAPSLKDDSNYYYIDSLVRVIGATTGYSIDIPVRFIKKKAS